ncbi:uncharacterized protein LOC132695500 [Cylas formicarius]|uniref:uncharacterized protein LOC132695500 n=1 Tax=Cylas formicarius TaxID=197179 RepID=UPI002958526D|nr:uncharacterized protein LOC132695500 [Cylas formicarius]
MNFQMSTIFLKKNLQGKEEDVSFAVDSDVTGLNIIVDPINTASVVLSSAGGLKMYFSKNAIGDDAKKFSTQSFSEYQEDVLEVHLNFSGKLSTTGVWKIAVEGADWLYNVAVFGFTSIVAQAFIDKKIVSDYKFPKDIVKLGVSGNVREITDIFFVDNIGHSASNFTYKFNESEKYVAGDNKTQHVNIEIDKNPNIQLPLYALIKGKDAQGHTFERLGYVGNHRGLFPSDPLTVDVGVGSELITKGQSRPQVFFEVTNQGNDVVTVTFTCSDQKYILQSLSTYRKVLSPLESTIVTLTLNTKGGVYQDEITFSAKAGSVFVQKKILVDVDSFNYFDDTEPRIDYSYTSDCTDVIFSKCEKGTWTIEITAQDLDSGLLQLNTIPKGLYVPNSYTAGTTEAVKGFYSDSCCNPNLKIIAIDRLNNRRIYTVNAYHARWSPGAIAALVLGIILFILLIVLIVWLVVRWKKQKESYDLPTYRGGGI